MYNGLLNVYKEAGYTSSDVVSKLRGILHQKKIGHTGTLDPNAVGVLVVCLGTGTRLAELLTGHDKEYIALVRLGVMTDTEDMDGTVLETRDVHVTHEALVEALRGFQGTYLQTPPMYSAIKQNGRRLYQLAREGKTVARAPREVTIEAISLLQEDLAAADKTFTIEVRCSKGTYIRTLCKDIGERLGCGAAMAHLTRTAVGAFSLDKALRLDEIEALHRAGTLHEQILPVDAIFKDLDAVHVTNAAGKKVDNGNPFTAADVIDFAPEDFTDREEEEDKAHKSVRVYREDNRFVGIYRYDSRTQRFLVEKMLGV